MTKQKRKGYTARSLDSFLPIFENTSNPYISKSLSSLSPRDSFIRAVKRTVKGNTATTCSSDFLNISYSDSLLERKVSFIDEPFIGESILISWVIPDENENPISPVLYRIDPVEERACYFIAEKPSQVVKKYLDNSVIPYSIERPYGINRGLYYRVKAPNFNIDWSYDWSSEPSYCGPAKLLEKCYPEINAKAFRRIRQEFEITQYTHLLRNLQK